MASLALLGAALALVSLIQGKIARWPITPPMLFVIIGMILSPDVTGWLDLHLDDETVVFAAELTLALVLFSDASRIDARELLTTLGLPGRLLGIGLPLTVLLGTAGTALLLTDLSWAEAAVVAAILAPTDAALGEAVITNPAVPAIIRRSLNVESGLNDGLVVPVVAVFVTLAAGEDLEGPTSLIFDALGEVAIAVAVGAVVAVLLAKAIRYASWRSLTNDHGFRLVALGGALTAFAGSVALGGNGFLASFICGLIARYAMREEAARHAELTEDLGHVGASATFVIFGALMVWPAIGAATALVVVCALMTLTLGRMIPVWVATRGTGLKAPTVLFLGWFGPRGLASMLFGLLLVAERAVDDPGDLFSIIALVVVLSVFLHGATAWWGAVTYGRWFTSMADEEDMMEAEECDEQPVRSDRRHR